MSYILTNEKNIIEKYNYNVYEGKLLSGAKKLEKYNFVTDIGGDNNGYWEVDVNVNNTCLYYLAINYVCYEPNLSFKVDINGLDNNKIYYVDFSSQWSINNSVTYTLPIVLNNGNNIIKFYGDGINNAPYLGNFILMLPPITNDLSKGVIENSAYVDLNTSFVNSIGGPMDGSTTVAVNVKVSGIYYLELKYISYYPSNFLKVNINGIEVDEIYNLNLSVIDNKIINNFTIPINLNYGNNTIKFHGDGFNYGPNLGNIKLYSINNMSTAIFSTSKTYKVSSGTLGDGAIIDKTTNMVTKLGGLMDGYLIVNIPIDAFGDYKININYTNNNRLLRIDINGVLTETIYNITGNKSGIFSTTLALVAGINSLKFHGNGKDVSPDIGDFTIELIKDNSSKAFLGDVSNGASILPKGIITGLGGVNDGRYTMNYNASDFGWYDIYLTLDTSQGNIISIDANFKNKNLIYNTPKANEAIVYIISIFLEKGENIFVFHGAYRINAPNILKIDLKLNIAFKDSIYNFVDGIVENGAIKDVKDNIVSGLGGIDNGSVTIKININEAKLYDLAINYIGEVVNSPLNIDIIGAKDIITSTVCILPLNNSSSDNFELQNFKISLPLIKGINNIKFYGNGINKVPKLSYVTVSESLIQNPIAIFSKTYSLVKEAIKKGYEINKEYPNFIKGLGKAGMMYLRNFIEVPIAGEYKIEIKYIKISDNEKFDIEINGEEREMYNPPKTNSLKESDAKNITFNKVLRVSNTLRFYRHNNDSMPLLGDITVTQITLLKNKPYKIIDIEMYDGAQKYGVDDFITFIGGSNNGHVYIAIQVDETGIYDFGFKYLCGSNSRTLNIQVDGKKNIYNVPLTQNWEIINAQTYTIPLELLRRYNVVRIGGNGYDFSPIIGKFNLDFNKNKFMITYDISAGTLKNGAKVNNYGLVTNIGGPKNGEVGIKVNVKTAGRYNLILQYKPVEKNIWLEVMVNDMIYYFENDIEKEWSLVDLPTLKTRIYLISGNNIINFRGLGHNQGSFDYAPFLGSFTLIGGYAEFLVEKKLTKGMYDLTKGKLENNADIIGDFVVDLGYNKKNSVTITVNIDITGTYFMTIKYISDRDSFLMFNINGQENGLIYYFEKRNCFINEVDIKIF